MFVNETIILRRTDKADISNYRSSCGLTNGLLQIGSKRLYQVNIIKTNI